VFFSVRLVCSPSRHESFHLVLLDLFGGAEGQDVAGDHPYATCSAGCKARNWGRGSHIFSLYGFRDDSERIWRSDLWLCGLAVFFTIAPLRVDLIWLCMPSTGCDSFGFLWELDAFCCISCSCAIGRLGISQFCAFICSIFPLDFGLQRCGLSLDRFGSGLFQIRSPASHKAAD
jgi:hypothetical protein